MLPELRGRLVVLAGKNVARAFGVRAEYHEWLVSPGCRAVVVPHPSGVNRWWNSADNREASRVFWTDLLGKRKTRENLE